MKKYETHLIQTCSKQLESLIKSEKARTQFSQKDVYYYSRINTAFETERFISVLKMLIQRFETSHNRFSALEDEIKSIFELIEHAVNRPNSPFIICIHEFKYTLHPLERSKFYVSIGLDNNEKSSAIIFNRDKWAHCYFNLAVDEQPQNENTEMPALEVPKWNNEIALSELCTLFSETTLISTANTVAL